MRSLIVSADDFGMSASVNAAILAAHDEGILTNCGLMVTGEAVAEAVAAARERPRLGVGLHLVLVCGRPALPAAKVPRLVEPGGRFLEDPLRAGLRLAFDRRARVEMRAEIEAQFAAFTATGLPMSHWDGHLHFHAHPAVFDVAAEVAERHGCRRVRLPCDDLRRHRTAAGWPGAPAALTAGIFALLAGYARRRLRGRTVHWPARTYGLFQTGHMTERYVLDLLPELPPGASELYLHPDTAPGPTGNGPVELAVLQSRTVNAALEAAGVRRITYHDLESAACR
jgi:hopanoid biosynthesis associated protein HpnK